MRQAWLSLLIILLIPIFLLALIVIHELGHTALARLLGDPSAVFYLVRANDNSGCMLGCTFYDVARLSRAANLAVSLGGLFAGQLAALTTLFLLGRRYTSHPLLQRLLSVMAFSFAFFDVPWQVLQALAADLGHSQWPTGSDLAASLSLLQLRFEVSPLFLKGLLLLVAVLYLTGFVWLYKRNTTARRPLERSVEDA